MTQFQLGVFGRVLGATMLVLLGACLPGGDPLLPDDGDGVGGSGGGGGTGPAALRCVKAGCSNQLCLSALDVAQGGGGSDCEWREEYACYQKAACEPQPDGTCGFTPTPALSACLSGAGGGTCTQGGRVYKDGESVPSGDCNSCTCSNGAIQCTLIACNPQPVITCMHGGRVYQPGDTFQDDKSCNKCTCHENGGVSCTEINCPLPAPQPACRRTGCSGQICADRDVASTCEWREEYACYKTAPCERQVDGTCGFTPTDALKMCLAKVGVCEYGGRTYRVGDTFAATDGCNTCSCTESGFVACTRRACPAP